MRISDWSSDVCSSDLNGKVQALGDVRAGHAAATSVRKQDTIPRGIADLAAPGPDQRGSWAPERHAAFFAALATQMRGGLPFKDNVPAPHADHLGNAAARVVHHAEQGAVRSEESRVGEAGVSTCRSRGWPYHK